MTNINPKASTFANNFAVAIEDKFNTTNQHPTLGDYEISVDNGRVFDKIVIRRGTHGSVHAFVDRKTGALIKAAGWKAPQKNVDGSPAARFDLAAEEGFTTAVNSADPYGSYLYAR